MTHLEVAITVNPRYSLREASRTWMQFAACRGMDPNLFAYQYRESTKDRRRREKHVIEWVCSRCPVRQACLDYALTNGEFGVWGGTTEEDRHKIVNGQKAKFRRKL